MNDLNQINAGADPVIDYTNWMSKTPGVLQKTLFELILPESHDSGSYNVDGGLLPSIGPWGKIINFLDHHHIGEIIGPIVECFTMTQPVSILEQLRAGVRVLDLRICWVNDQFHIHHGPIVCELLSTVLSDIKTFLTEAESELVVIVASHFAFNTYPPQPCAPHPDLANVFFTALGDKLMCKMPQSIDALAYLKTKSVDELLECNSKAIVIFDTKSLETNPDNRIWFPNPLNGGYADTTDLLTMFKYEQNLVDQHAKSPGEELFQLQWILTPNTDYVLCKIEEAILEVGLNPTNILKYLDEHGLKAMAKSADEILSCFVKINATQHINTLRLDYCAGSSAVDLAIKLNEKEVEIEPPINC